MAPIAAIVIGPRPKLIVTSQSLRNSSGGTPRPIEEWTLLAL